MHGGYSQAGTILIDGFNLPLEKGTGVATYARNLSEAVHSLGHRVEVLYGMPISAHRDPLLREIAFFDPPSERKAHRMFAPVRRLLHSSTGVRAFSIPSTEHIIKKVLRGRLPYFDALWNVPDLFVRANDGFRRSGGVTRVRVPSRPNIAHWTYPLPIKIAGARNVYTLHDLVPLRLPYTTLDNKRIYFKMVRRLAQRADHIVTVSENSKRDIISLLGAPESRVSVTYQAVAIPRAYAEKPLDLVRNEIQGTFGLQHGSYFLFFGSIEPKKNVGRLIEAYLAADVDTPLVIVAAQSWKREQELRPLAGERLPYAQQGEDPRSKVILRDYVSFPVLVSLIRGAKAVLFPSLYEGFGLPVLEAMSLGTPVLTSNVSSLPEVAGEAAILVDPYDVREMAEAIKALDADDNLRSALRERGPKQAEKFSTDRYQARLRDLYGRLQVSERVAV
jgi:glycosyltransferase involved in cell wall biosynthesis